MKVPIDIVRDSLKSTDARVPQIDSNLLRRQHAVGLLLFWSLPALLFALYLKFTSVPADFAPYLDVSAVMLIYTVVGISLALVFIDRALLDIVNRLNGELRQEGVISGSQPWIRRYFALNFAVLLLYLLIGWLVQVLDSAGNEFVSPKRLMLLQIGVTSVIGLFLFVIVPQFLFSLNLLGRHIAPHLAQPLAFPSSLRLFLQGPGVVFVFGLLIIGLAWINQLPLPNEAFFALAVLLIYAAIISLLSYWGSQNALQPLYDFTRMHDSTISNPPPSVLKPQSLDEVGALTHEVRQIVEREQQTIHALVASEDRFRMFAQASSDWFFEVDADLRFSYVSDKLQEITGVPPEALLGQGSLSVGSQYEETDYVRHRDDLLAHKPYRNYRFDVTTPEGRTLHLQISGLPHFDVNGEFRGYRGTGTDITDLVNAQYELEAQSMELAQSQKMTAVGQLTGGLAHDFNNLLTVIMGNLELAQMSCDDAQTDLSEQIDAALLAAERGSTLVAQLMAFSRKQALRATNVDMAALFDQMRPLLDRTLAENIRVVIDIQDATASCWADAAQLESALLNLALNARDAMPDGGELRFKTGMVDASDNQLLEPGNYVFIEVSDTGYGIDPDLLNLVFEPFFTTKELGEGTGLGLSMVYGFVKQSGGDVSIDSILSKGTTVKIWLPSLAAVPVKEPQIPNPAIDSGFKSSEGGRILVVEDDAGVRGLLTDQLERLGYQATVRESAGEALALLQSGNKFDLLLSDIVLTDSIDGIELIERALQIDPQLRYLLMTGYTNRQQSINDRQVLRKPFTLQDLDAALAGCEAQAVGQGEQR